MSKLLVTFCNTYSETPLMVLDTEMGTTAIGLGLNIENGQISGLTGITKTFANWVFGVQSTDGNSYLLFLDEDLKKVGLHKLDKVKDIHDVVCHSENIYACSTGNDSIYNIDVNNKENLIYQVSTRIGDFDNCHINSLVFLDKFHLAYSKFTNGRTKGQSWKSVINEGSIILGGVFSPELPLHENLHGPHSLKVIDDKLCFCESGAGILHIGNDSINVYGYIRGLASDKDNYYVGRSVLRTVSRSTGEIVVSPIDDEGLCGIVAINKQSLAPVKFYDLGFNAQEIYGIELYE